MSSPAPAVIVRIDPDGYAEVAADDLWFPNGMVVSEDARTLIVAARWTPRATPASTTPVVRRARH